MVVAATAEPELADPRRILGQLPHAVIVVDDEWRVDFCNAAALKILGDDGQTLWERYPQIDATAFGATFREAMANRIAITTETGATRSYLVHLVRAIESPTYVKAPVPQQDSIFGTVAMSGSTFVVGAPRANVVHGGSTVVGAGAVHVYEQAPDGRIVFVTTLAASNPGTGDELEDLGRAFNALLDRRRAELERQQRFTGDASHQLRTPVAGLLSLVEVVRRRPRPAEEYEQTLDQVHREANRLRQIVDSLLFLARTEAESEPLKGEPIDLAAWVPPALARWRSHKRADDLRFEGPDHGVWTRAHAPLLAQAVENLVDNAFKYSEPGSPITVRVWREPGAACLAVEDHGCGLNPEEAASAFEPFYQSPRARLIGRGGVGLGLSVVQRIVDAARGSIRVESRPGQGSRFTIRLPEDVAPVAFAPKTTLGTATAPEPSRGAKSTDREDLPEQVAAGVIK